MSPLRQHMLAALHLNGKSERTQVTYVREVRLLAQFYHTSPDRISEQALQRYCLHRTNVDGLAPASMRLWDSGIRHTRVPGALPPSALRPPHGHQCHPTVPKRTLWP